MQAWSKGSTLAPCLAAVLFLESQAPLNRQPSPRRVWPTISEDSSEVRICRIRVHSSQNLMVKQVVSIERRLQRHPLSNRERSLHIRIHTVHPHLTHTVHTSRKNAKIISRRLACRISDKTIAAIGTSCCSRPITICRGACGSGHRSRIKPLNVIRTT